MIVIKKWMLFAEKKNSNENTRIRKSENMIEVEETTPSADQSNGKSQFDQITTKEWLIVALFWVLAIICISSFIIYLIMNYQNHPNSDNVLKIFTYTLTTIIGYFLGTNKDGR